MKPLCLIIDQMHPSILDMLERVGIQADYRPDITPEEVYERIAVYTGLILRSKFPIGKELLKKAVNLKFIARAGAGMELIDQEAIRNAGIALINAPEGNKNAVAEHTVALILNLFNNIGKGHTEVMSGIWEREGNRGIELSGKTVCVFGYGNMGKAVAEKLRCLGCRILAYDKDSSKTPQNERADLETVFRESDVLSLHVPLDSGTRYLVNYSFLKRFLKKIWIINTSRGEILALQDLLRAIKEGGVAGAGLDVLENEKFQELNGEQKMVLRGLSDTQKVIFSPHVAGWTFESYVRINQVLVEKILQLPLGKTKQGC